MNVEFLIKDKNGSFINFDKNDFKLIDEILYSKTSIEEYENILFADKDFLNNIDFYEFKIITDEGFNAMYFEFSEGVEFEKYQIIKSKHKNVGNIGFSSPTKEFFIITKNEIINNKIKITKKPGKDNILYLFFIKNQTQQNIEYVKKIIGNMKITIL